MYLKEENSREYQSDFTILFHDQFQILFTVFEIAFISSSLQTQFLFWHLAILSLLLLSWNNWEKCNIYLSLLTIAIKLSIISCCYKRLTTHHKSNWEDQIPVGHISVLQISLFRLLFPSPIQFKKKDIQISTWSVDKQRDSYRYIINMS